MPHFLRHEAPTQDTEAACNVAKEVDRKYAVSDGEEGIGNVVVIGLIPSTQGLCLSPEELRYIIVLFYQDGAPSTVGIGVETTTQPRFWSNTDSEVSLFELTDGSAWKTGNLQNDSLEMQRHFEAPKKIHVFGVRVKDHLHDSWNRPRSPFDSSNFVRLSSTLRILGFHSN